MTQYWWHRITHNTPWLYNLHRPHHQAEYLSIRIVYRNNIFYYFLMPGLWFTGALIYLGGGWVYAVYIVIKMTIIYGAHSDIRWDSKLYNIKWLAREYAVSLGHYFRNRQNYAPISARIWRRKPT